MKFARRFNMIIADDEEYSRKNLFSKISKLNLGIDIISCCEDGRQVLQVLENHEVDIILTDIEMPYINGIELLNEIRKRNYKTKVIFITAYEVFEYAKKGIELGAFAFLLKPINDSELANTIQKVCFEIENFEHTQLAVDFKNQITSGDFISHIFEGKYSNQEIIDKSGEFGIPLANVQYAPLVLSLDMKEDTGIRDTLMQHLNDENRRLSEELNINSKIFFDHRSRLLVPVLFAFPDSIDVVFFLEKFMERIIELNKIQKAYTLTFAIGRTKGSIAWLQKEYEFLKSAIETRHINGLGSIIRISEKSASPRQTDIDISFDGFIQHVKKSMKEEVLKDIENVFNIYRNNALRMNNIRLISLEMILTASRESISNNVDSVTKYAEKLQYINTIEEMKSTVSNIVINDILGRKEEYRHKEQVVSKALEFINQNYSDPNLKLDDIADFIGISVPYLAVLFRQKTGKTFTNHLLAARMDIAKSLLSNSDKNIIEISESVGFSSPQYFSQCFKKYTGISPLDYRKETYRN